tara:strand:+ start:353 stop:658 length:306 start_codon:yes stop_codon:yes gene_type:complete
VNVLADLFEDYVQYLRRVSRSKGKVQVTPLANPDMSRLTAIQREFAALRPHFTTLFGNVCKRISQQDDFFHVLACVKGKNPTQKNIRKQLAHEIHNTLLSR